MKKTLLMAVVALMTTMGAFAEAAFTAKQVPVNRGGEAGGTVTLRFYDDLPSVAYISVADFQALMLPGSQMTVTKTGDGQYTLENQYAKAMVNTATEQFSSDDYMAFTNLMSLIQKEGMDNVYLDGAPFIRYRTQEVTPAAVTTTFDFQKYGIDLRGDDGAVYFPFATIADLYSDLYYHIAGYNGEKVVLVTENANSDICKFEPERAMAILEQQTRAADLADFTYKELCFVIDHFYGMPGRSPYENAIKENGLDKALSDNIIDNGTTIKQLLTSTNMKDYVIGMTGMQAVLADGGHTGMYVDLKVISGLNLKDGVLGWLMGFTYIKETYPALYQMISDRFLISMISRPQDKAIDKARSDKGITDYYYKAGDTAYLIYPQFISNFAAWREYYAGGCTGNTPAVDTDFPGDLSVVLDAMKQANDDPEVKNLIIDVANNGGGSLDIVMAMTALIAGQSHYYSENTLTKQRMLVSYDVDCNFDGVFDEQDKEVWKNYNLNYGVLTSCISFSCANLFPSLMKDMGFPIIGEKSGGGACAVQNFVTPEGLQFQISSYRGRLTDKNWNEIDSGVTPNYPIAVASGDPVAYDYSAFYDVSVISTIMNTALSLASLPTDAKTADDAWYTLDGRRLIGRPTQRGVYVNNHKKVVIKVGSN